MSQRHHHSPHKPPAYRMEQVNTETSNTPHKPSSRKGQHAVGDTSNLANLHDQDRLVSLLHSQKDFPQNPTAETIDP